MVLLAADIIIPFDTAWQIYKKILVYLNVHPNVEAWFTYNQSFKEIVDARNRYEELHGQIPMVPPECECENKQHECHCLDSYNKIFNATQEAKVSYDSTRSANYSDMVNRIDGYYKLWFRDTYGETIKNEINQEFINELQRMAKNMFRKWI